MAQGKNITRPEIHRVRVSSMKRRQSLDVSELVSRFDNIQFRKSQTKISSFFSASAMDVEVPSGDGEMEALEKATEEVFEGASTTSAPREVHHMEVSIADQPTSVQSEADETFPPNPQNSAAYVNLELSGHTIEHPTLGDQGLEAVEQFMLQGREDPDVPGPSYRVTKESLGLGEIDRIGAWDCSLSIFPSLEDIPSQHREQWGRAM